MSKISALPKDRAGMAGLLPDWEVLRNREFMLVWSSGSLVWLCRWTEWVVLGLLMLELVDSPFLVAMALVANWSPMLFLSAFTGLIADRLERWRILLVAHIGGVLLTSVLLGLILTDAVRPWHVYVIAFMLGCLMALDWPTRGAFMSDLVGPRNVVRAMSMESIAFGVGSLVGPLIGGFLIELVGFKGPWSFLLGIYVMALVVLLLVKSRVVSARIPRESAFRSLASGIQYAFRNKLILAVLACTIAQNMAGFSSTALYPVVAKEHLGVGPGLTGLMVSAQGVGMLAGALILASLGTLKYQGRVFGQGCIIILAATLGFALSPWYPLSVVMLFLTGLGLSAYFALQRSITLTSTEPEMQGRVMGTVALFIGFAPIGALAAGGTADVLGAPLAIRIFAVAGLLMLIPIFFWTPLMRRQPAGRPGPVSAEGPASSSGDLSD